MKWSTAWAFVWISCALAISTAIYITKSANPLWALLIPACISFKSSEN
jgi:hypothetical protein